MIAAVRDTARVAWAMALALAGCTFGSSGAGGSGSGNDADADSGDATTHVMIATMSPATSAASASADGGASTGVDPSADSTTATAEGSGTDAGTSSTNTGDAGSSSSGGATTCDKALWVIGDLAIEQTADAALYERLLAVGFDVTLVDNAASSATDVADNCVVILSAVGSSGDVGAKFRDVTVPVVVLESFLYDDMGMVEPGTEGVAGGENIEILDAAHPMAAGLAGVVNMYLPSAEIGAGVVSPTAQVVATRPPEPTAAAIFGYASGAMMVGLPAPARRVGFAASGANASGPTTDGLDLFEAAVSWAAS